MRRDLPRVRRPFRTRPGFGWVVLALLAGPALGQEPTRVPGQSSQPKVVGPAAPDAPEEERVRLDRTAEWFQVVSDGPFRLRGQDEKLPDELAEARGKLEMKAYNYVLAFAKDKPPDLLRKYSTKDVPFSNLLADVRRDYFRDLMYFRGTIRLLQPLKPTDELRDLDGIAQLYELWMVPDGYSNLLCLVVSELPDGVTTGADLHQRAAFDAYYFKHYHYESGQKKPDGKNQWMSAPLFLGRSFEPLPPLDDGPAFTGSLLAGVLGGLSAVVLVAVGLGLWFRRGDRRVRAVAARRNDHVKFDDGPGPDGPANRITDHL